MIDWIGFSHILFPNVVMNLWDERFFANTQNDGLLCLWGRELVEVKPPPPTPSLIMIKALSFRALARNLFVKMMNHNILE